MASVLGEAVSYIQVQLADGKIRSSNKESYVGQWGERALSSANFVGKSWQAAG